MKAELLSCKAVAGMLDISIRQVWRMRDGGLLPAPVKLGGSVRWRRADLESWIEAGCPDVRRGEDAARGVR